jgi:hypothetical protein
VSRIRFYNLERSHQGYRLNGRTPAQGLGEDTGQKKLPTIILTEDEATAVAAE